MKFVTLLYDSIFHPAYLSYSDYTNFAIHISFNKYNHQLGQQYKYAVKTQTRHITANLVQCSGRHSDKRMAICFSQLQNSIIYYSVCSSKTDNNNQTKVIVRLREMNMTFLLFFTSVLLLFVSSQDCCLELSEDRARCLKCPENMRYFKGHCLFQVPNCLSYSGVQCQKCESPYVSSWDGHCQQVMIPYEDHIVDLEQERIKQFTELATSSDSRISNANLTMAFERTYANGTVHIFSEFSTQNNQIYQLLAEVIGNGTNLALNILSLKPLEELEPVNTDEAEQEQEQQAEIQMKQNMFHQYRARSIYQYMPTQERNQDKGFQTIDSLLMRGFQKELGKDPTRIAVYIQRKSIYNCRYKLYYRSSVGQRKIIYEARVIYNRIKERVFVLSFTRTYRI